jgi:hypothetical protein
MKRSALLLLASVLLLSGCSVARWERMAVARQNEFHVTLEQRWEQDAVVQQYYDHPCQIDLSDLTRVLSELTASQEGGLMKDEGRQPVFQAGEVERLAPALQDALARANADQRVRFVSYNLEKSILISFSRKTEGVLFVDSSGSLNIAFNSVNANRRSSESSAMNPSFAEEDPLAVRSAESTLKVPSYATARALASGQPAPLWLLVDLQQLRQTPRAAAAPARKQVKTAASSPAPVKKAIPVPVAEEKPAPRAKPVVEEPLAAAEDESFTIEVVEEEPPMASPEPAVEPVPERQSVAAPAPAVQEEVGVLDYFQELLDEGLISAEDFDNKKKALLRGEP